MTMCLRPDGFVVDDVEKAVLIDVHWPTDGCLIKQMYAVSLRCVDRLEDAVCCRSLDDTQEVADVMDGQWSYRCRLVQLELSML